MTQLKDVVVVPNLGVYNRKTNAYVEESFLYRQNNRAYFRQLPNDRYMVQLSAPVNLDTDMPQLDSAFFAGWKMDHFGHFLLESLSRLSRLPKEKTTVLWLTPLPKKVPFVSWQLEIFQLLGIDHHDHVVVTVPTLVHQLTLVEPEYRIWDKFTAEHAQFLACYDAATDVIKGKKLWLSRSAFNIKKGGWVNEKAIESILASCGWIIYHPEQHSIHEQLTELLSAEIIAGIEGSAFHTLILAKQVSSQVIIFARSKKLNPNYQLIASVTNLEQIVHNVPKVRLAGQDASSVYLVELQAVLKRLSCQDDIVVDNNDITNLTSYVEKLTQGVLFPKMTYKVLKASAELLEEIDLVQAHALMQLAQQLNPTGPVIQVKLAEYEERLKQPPDSQIAQVSK